MQSISVNVTDTDYKVLQYNIDIPIDKWVEDIIQNKIDYNRKILKTEFVQKMVADGSLTSIPTDEEELIALILGRQDFETVDQRRAREEAERAAKIEQEEAERAAKIEQEEAERAAAAAQAETLRLEEAERAAVAAQEAAAARKAEIDAAVEAALIKAGVITARAKGGA